MQKKRRPEMPNERQDRIAEALEQEKAHHAVERELDAMVRRSIDKH